MKNEKEQKRDIIHQVLDGDAAPAEQREMMARIQADPAMKQEFDSIAQALRSVEKSERMPVPAFFTAEVMRRLPRRKAPLASRVRDFLFQGRALKWNMATAFAGVALVVLALTQVVRIQNRPVETAAVPAQDQLVTVAMNLYAPQAHHVAVAGTFNKWKVDANVLKKDDKGLWTINVPLKPGAYTYMFVVDGKVWVADPNAQAYDDDGFGQKNSVVRVNI
jgi:anti-sigma factor RsiW